jgi:hypothetical protein
VDYELISAEVVRALRGRRSQAAFSRRLGYKSNIVHRWEAQKSFPAASSFLHMVARSEPKQLPALLRFFPRLPSLLGGLDLTSPAAVSCFLRELQGKTPIVNVARSAGYNRYSVSRWLTGAAEPRLPQFLQLIEVMSRRLLDFLACCTDPARLPSVAAASRRLALTRHAAYEHPWSHAVLRALELEGAQRRDQEAWLCDRLGLAVPALEESLAALEATEQVQKVRGRWKLKRVVSVNTSQDRERAHSLKLRWTETALERMRAKAPGNYGYSVFSVSRPDLRRLRDVHLEYVRAMQGIIAASAPGECVGLYCAQLLDLAKSDNALAE